MAYLSSYLSEYFDTIQKINEYYRTNKPVDNIDQLFNKAEFLRSASEDIRIAMYTTYHSIDVMDDDYAMEGMRHGKLSRDGTQVILSYEDDGIVNIAYECQIPQSIIDLTFADRHSKIQSEVTVIAFIQRVNTLLARDTEYQKNRKGYLNEQYGKECVQYDTTETDEVQCGGLH